MLNKLLFKDDTTEAIRLRVQNFLDKEINESILKKMEVDGEEHSLEITRKLGQEGFLGLAWPKELGGQGLGHLAQAVVFEECSYRRAPVVGAVLSQIIGSTLAALEPESKRTYEVLNRLREGTTNICVGYTEPDAGSDLASLQTSAIFDGDQLVINGVKTFQSAAHVSDLYYLAVRTDSTVKPHDGITMLLFDTKTDGVHISPLETCGGFKLNKVEFKNVRVPANSIVGGLNNGWSVLRTSLKYGRTVPWRVGQVRRLKDQILTIYNGFTKENKNKWRDEVFHCMARTDAATLLVYKVLELEQEGGAPMSAAAISKLYISELIPKMSELAMDMLGADGCRKVNSEGAPLRGEIEWAYRQFQERRWAEGATEIQKNIVAQTSLGLPR